MCLVWPNSRVIKKFLKFYPLRSVETDRFRKAGAPIHNMDHSPTLRILSFPVCHHGVAVGEMTTCPLLSPHHRVRFLLILPVFQPAGLAPGFDGACESHAAGVFLLAHWGYSAFFPPYQSGQIIQVRLVK